MCVCVHASWSVSHTHTPSTAGPPATPHTLCKDPGSLAHSQNAQRLTDLDSCPGRLPCHSPDLWHFWLSWRAVTHLWGGCWGGRGLKIASVGWLFFLCVCVYVWWTEALQRRTERREGHAAHFGKATDRRKVRHEGLGHEFSSVPEALLSSAGSCCC